MLGHDRMSDDFSEAKSRACRFALVTVKRRDCVIIIKKDARGLAYLPKYDIMRIEGTDHYPLILKQFKNREAAMNISVKKPNDSEKANMLTKPT